MPSVIRVDAFSDFAADSDVEGSATVTSRGSSTDVLDGAAVPKTTIIPTFIGPRIGTGGVYYRDYTCDFYFKYSPINPDNVEAEQLFFTWSYDNVPPGLNPAAVVQSATYQEAGLSEDVPYGVRIAKLTIQGQCQPPFSGYQYATRSYYSSETYTVTFTAVDSSGRHNTNVAGESEAQITFWPYWLLDMEPPSITVLSHSDYQYITPDGETHDEELVIRVTDAFRGSSGIVSVGVNGNQVSEGCTGSDVLTLTVPITLQLGVNDITIEATDDSLNHNRTEQHLYLLYGADVAAPEIEVTDPVATPPGGTPPTTVEAFYTITGTAVDSIGGTGIRWVRVNGADTGVHSDGTEQVEFAKEMALSMGLNIFNIVASNHGGKSSYVERRITRNVAGDGHPPTLVITNPASTPVDVIGETFIITGYAHDAGTGDNGIARVVVNDTWNTDASAAGSNTATFFKEVNLSIGHNVFTIKAEDRTGEQTEDFRVITRLA